MSKNTDSELAQTSHENEKVDSKESVSDPDSSRGIRLVDIEKRFGGGEIVACADISLNIEQGEFVVLLGPSGCGKTTTLRIISGLEKADSGSVIIAGEDVSHKKPKDRNLAFVFQNIALYPHMNVRENMRFGLDMKSDLSKSQKQERIDEAAKLLGIEDLLNRKPRELSGGQQQRVSLGRAMVTQPKAFLLDEPFSALDANLRDRMRVEVKKLQRELDTTMIFVTHDQEDALTLGDKIIVMQDGHIQQIGTPTEIYNEPNNQFVAEFIGSPSTNIIDAEVVREEGQIMIKNDFLSFSLSHRENTDKLSVNQQIRIGIRPEYFELDAEKPLFSGELEVIESHGMNDAVHFTVDDNSLTGVVDQGKINQEMTTIPINIDTNRIWLFDQSGNRVL